MRAYVVIVSTALLLLLGVTPPASAAAPAGAHDCEACHGAGGVSTDKDIPTIAGMSAFYLDGEIQAYQRALRPCTKLKPPGQASAPETSMCDIAKKLSTAESGEIDKYFAAQHFLAAKQTWDTKSAAVGKQIHAADCEICHTQGGSVADDDAGILSGQWMPYLQQTFAEYQSDKRSMPDKMKPKFAGLTPDKIDALIQYYASGQK